MYNLRTTSENMSHAGGVHCHLPVLLTEFASMVLFIQQSYSVKWQEKTYRYLGGRAIFSL